jgi:hypothetical protein
MKETADQRERIVPIPSHACDVLVNGESGALASASLTIFGEHTSLSPSPRQKPGFSFLSLHNYLG